MFFVRVGSGIILILILLCSIIFSVELLGLFCGVVSLIGLYEFYNLRKLQLSLEAIVSYIATIAYYISLVFFMDKYTIVILPVSLIIMGIVYVIKYSDRVPENVMHIIFGFVYITIMFSFLIRIRMLNMGDVVIWIVFLSSWGTDSLAYVSGRLFGKHKLAPVLSPKKSIEGAIGGVLGSMLLTYIFVFIFEKLHYNFTGIYTIQVYVSMLLITFVASIISQFGDLFASAFKRHFGVKDYGKLIPGHGGVLDRFDSVLFVAPIIYFILIILNFS